MNIVILNDFAYVDGGASKIALGSAKALATLGHRVILFTGVGPVNDELLDVSRLEVHNLNLHEIVEDPNRARAAANGLWNFGAARRLRVLLNKLEPSETVVHIHTWTKALSSSVIRAATQLGFRTVLTMHDYFTVCPTGGFFIHPTQSICSLRPLSLACIGTDCDSRSYGHKVWRTARQWLQENPGNLFAGVRDYISISNLSELVVRPYLPRDVEIHRVPNFVDLERQPPVAISSNSTFSFIGRLSAEKGPRLLAESTKTGSFAVQFIGDGPLRREISQTLPFASFTGWLPPRRAREALSISRALVFPSLWYETQGLVVAEAAAMGIPAIVPSTSAACEWVEDNQTGLIFKGGDSEDLTRKLIHLRDDPVRAAEMGLEAYRRYWDNPASLDQHCRRLEAVYDKILAKRRPEPTEDISSPDKLVSANCPDKTPFSNSAS